MNLSRDPQGDLLISRTIWMSRKFTIIIQPSFRFGVIEVLDLEVGNC
jgi:hypothetical protein